MNGTFQNHVSQFTNICVYFAVFNYWQLPGNISVMVWKLQSYFRAADVNFDSFNN